LKEKKTKKKYDVELNIHYNNKISPFFNHKMRKPYISI
jgi:hypothetical protein